MEESIASIAVGDDIRPYKIHVSSKYLELTRKKLELTRLPHEILLPRSREWEQGTPKSEIEPLIDFWLEQYSWRARETQLNDCPQYRTSITISNLPTPFRVHFIHIKSSHANAVPLLLLPSFPLTNLSLIPLLEPLANPQGNDQPFHVVAPSIPGLGFSDAFTFLPFSSSVSSDSSPPVLESTAYLFNVLMLRLGYTQYVTSSTGSGSSSPANIDYHIPRLLALNHSDHCLGIHLIDPPVPAPILSKEPWSWAKFAVAKFFHAPIFGYVAEDWKALTSSLYSTEARRNSGDLESGQSAIAKRTKPRLMKPKSTTSMVGLSAHGLLATPNTLAYALCDSPIGLLSLVLAGLKRLSPFHALSQTEIIDVTQLAWLPGPEGAMRFWSSAAVETASGKGHQVFEKRNGTATGVTTFLGDEGDSEVGYRPPTWAAARHNVVFTARHQGSAGLLAWERADAILEGIRGVASTVIKANPDLVKKTEEARPTSMVIEEEEDGGGDGLLGEGSGIQINVESPDAESPDSVVLSKL